MKFSKTAIFLALALLQSATVHAFPGMIRHGYVNCTACHVSPTGAGILTRYGRELSKEVISTWPGGKKEHLFVGGALENVLPENLLMGGDIRSVASYKNNPVYTEKRWFLMQADGEAAYRIGKFTLDVQAGYADGAYRPEDLSRRHFVMYQPDAEWSFRLGRFRPAYGINTTEHTLTIKRPTSYTNLGFDEGTESYNVEAAWLTGEHNLFVTAIAGRLESTSTEEGIPLGVKGYAEKGGAVRYSRFFADHYEIGANYYYGSDDRASRHLAGPFAILGFTERVFLLSEFDYQFNKPKDAVDQKGLLTFNRLVYEPIKGVQVFGQQEQLRTNFSNKSAGYTERYGLGFNFFPRPHIEIEGIWHKQKAYPDIEKFADYAWLMLHYYL